MKLIHIADMHFDTPFTMLSAKGEWGEIRRLEQRKVFQSVIEYIKKYHIGYLLISGDLYEHTYVRESTIAFIDKLFREIPNTKIFIAPGNHDPYIKDSYYETWHWSDNVYIFRDRIEKYQDEEVVIYGMGFTDFYMSESPLENLVIEDSQKLNILVTHCDLNGYKDTEGFSYNPISESKLKSIGFDYVAMGHIHKNNVEKNNRICYPGSLISLGFDELGKHGMIEVTVSKKQYETKFIPLDERMFTEIVINVENITSKEELIEYISSIKYNKMNFYKVILTGTRNFEINTRELLNILSSENILKVTDQTKLPYDLEMLAKENTLKGIFVQEILKKMTDENYTKEEIEKAIEIGLEAM